MEPFDVQMLHSMSSMLPLAVLMIEDGGDRQCITDLYLQYRPLMYKTIRSFFKDDEQELEDAFGQSVIRMCKYARTLRFMPEEKRPVYLLCIVRSVCNSRLKERYKRQALDEVSYDLLPEDTIDPQADPDIVFSRFNALDLLNSFEALSQREKELIRMRHIDQCSYEEIAQTLNISKGAVRTAICRAKEHLEQQASLCQRRDAP